MADLLTGDQVAAQCSVLRQYASVLADFYEALRVSHLPEEACRDLVTAWWTQALQTERVENDDG